MKNLKKRIVQGVIGLMLLAGPVVAAGYGSGDLPVGSNIAGHLVTTVANKLNAFAATTSTELRSVISDAAGTGSLVFATSPTLVTPNIGSAVGSISGNAGTATALQTARTINGISFDGTANITAPAAAGTLTGSTLASGVTASSLTSVGTLGNLTVTNPINGSVTGSAGTVTTNANLTGPITSTGNATAVASQTGTGSTFVMNQSPTLVTPNIGAATATSINGMTLTPSTGTLAITSGKTLTATNTLTFGGTDGSSVAFGTGGTAAYTQNNLGVFASTTSAQLAGIISDETGTGALVFGTSPVFTTPNIGNATGNAATATTLSGTSTANSLAGYNNSGVFSGVTVGSNLTLSGGTLSATGGGQQNLYTTVHNTCDLNIAADLRSFMDAHGGVAVMPPGCYLVDDLGAGAGNGINLIEQQPNTVTYEYDTGHYFVHNSDTPDTSYFDSKTTISDICLGDSCTSGPTFVNTDDKLTRLTVASTTGYHPGDYVNLVDAVPTPWSATFASTKTITNVAWNSGLGKCIVTFSGSHGYSSTLQIYFNGIVGTGSIGALTGMDGTTFSGLTSKFNIGDTVTGGTSGATAILKAVTYRPNSVSTGVFNFKNATGVFAAGETITGALGGSATLTTPFGWGRTYNITSESSTTVSLQTLDNAGGGSTGTNVDCSTGAYTSGGKSSQKNYWAGEGDRVAQVDPVGGYIYLTQPLQYSNLYVDQPVLYRYAAPYTVSITGGTATANGDTSDVSNQTASNAAIDIEGIPEVRILNFNAKNTWDASVILQGAPGAKVDNIKSRQLPNRATLVTGTPRTITNVTSANPAVFTSTAHGFTTSSQIGFLPGAMPAGFSSIENQIYHVVPIDANTFTLQNTNNESVNTTGFPSWSGAVATSDTDDVTGLGYTVMVYGSSFGTVVNGIECWEGRHCITSGSQQSTWTATPSGTSAIWGQGQPTWVTIENGVAHGAYGISWDSHEGGSKWLWRNLSCERPLRGYEYGTYQGHCFQTRNKNQTYVNVRAYSGTGGGYIRSVGVPQDSPPEYTFVDDHFEDMKNLWDNSSQTSSVGDPTAITTEDATANIFWPTINIDNTDFMTSYIGVDIAKANAVHMVHSRFKNVREPIRQQAASLLDAENVINDQRTMDYSHLTSASVTPWTPATGAKSFQVATGGAYRPNMIAVITSGSSPSTIYAIGKVQSITSTTLSILVNTFAGSGSHTDWHITAGWPTDQVRSDLVNGSPYSRINDLHTYNGSLLPSTAFGEDDANATKNYYLGEWTDQSTATIGKLYVSPWQTTFSALTDTSQDLNVSTTVGGGTVATALNNLGFFASTTSAQLRGVISDETGTGAACFATSPTLVTPVLGAATATSINGLAFTTSTGTLTIANGKTLTDSNTLTFAGTDGSTLNVGTGGTLGTAAFTAASAYEVPLTFSTGLTRSTNTITVNTSQNIATLSNLTSNGFVKTGGGVGTLSVDTNTYAQASQVFPFLGFLEGPTNKLYTIAYKPGFGGTVGNTKTVCTGGGTATVQFNINGTPMGAANSATSSGDNVTQTSANAFISTDIISATVSANASCIDLSLTATYTRTLN